MCHLPALPDKSAPSQMLGHMSKAWCEGLGITLVEKDFWDLDILIEIPESSGAAGSGEESSRESLVSWGLGILKDAFRPWPQAGMRLMVSLGPRVMLKNAQTWFVELSMTLGSCCLTCQLPPHPVGSPASVCWRQRPLGVQSSGLHVLNCTGYQSYEKAAASWPCTFLASCLMQS